MNPLRFGILPFTGHWRLPLDRWLTIVKSFEALGYSTVFQCDHFRTLINDPIAMLASAAAVTQQLNVGSFVFDVDYRHPVILAKAAATLHLISGGRFEFGIGAGWNIRDYTMAGIPYDPPRKRVERLSEALTIIRSMWTQDTTSFTGVHYRITEMEKAGDLSEGECPKIMIGGGGRKMLTLAGQHADVVGILHRWKGSMGQAIRDQTIDTVKRKIDRVKTTAEASDRDPDALEFQLYIPYTEITDNPEPPLVETVAKQYNVTVDEVRQSVYVLIGSRSDIIKKIQTLRDDIGVNYFVFSLRDTQWEEYAKSIVKPLTT